jgi:hypothetical protein
MSRLQGKFVQDSTITDLQIRLRNNLALRARNAGDTADVEILKISATDLLTVLREMSMNNAKIVNLADPTAGTDAANKQYVDSTVAGLTDPKEAVRLATTGALAASTYANGTAGDGATITADANGAIGAIDGVTPSVGDRILIKNQASNTENGIYELTQEGDAGNPFIFTRASDADNSGNSLTEVTQGMYVPVAEGSVNGSLGYIMTSLSSDTDPQGPLILGTDGLSFTQFGEVIQAGQGITKTGQQIAIDAGDGVGFNGSDQLIVVVDDDLVTGTTKLAGGAVVGRKTFEESFTLNATDISNGYVDLSKVASEDSEIVFPRFGIKQKKTVDWTASYTGGASSKTRITFAGDLASIVASGDILDITFESLDY